MKGAYYRRLVVVLKAAKAAGISQTDIGAALGVDQKTISNWLKAEAVEGGTFDLDAADVALRRIGSTLRDFVNEVPVPARPASKLPPTLAKIVRTLTLVDEEGLQHALELSQSVRRRFYRRTGKQSASRFDDGQSKKAASTASQSRRRPGKDPVARRRG